MRYYSTLRPVSIGSYPEKDKVKELKRCDVYADWYETKEAAEQAVKDALMV